MAVGLPLPTNYTDGEVWSAADVNDITGTINQLGGSNFAAGKNKIINGDFGVWQRGTSFSLSSATGIFAADRFAAYADFTGGSVTVSRQAFTPGTAPVSGYEGQYFSRWAQTSGSANTVSAFTQRIENIQTYAGQTVTLSFWAKADAARTVTTAYEQYCGSGGSGYINASIGSYSVTTSWTRFTTTFTVPSISGKTVGASSYLQIGWFFPLNTTQTIDIWGIQLEAGSTATAFQTATGTIQGELAACQRYYYRTSSSASNPYALFTQAFGANSSTQVYTSTRLPVSMRIPPVAADYANLQVADGSNLYAVTSIVLDANTSTQDIAAVGYNVSSGLTQYRPYAARGNNSSSAYLGFSAEL